MNAWEIVHGFNRLVESGKVQPLVCEQCARRLYVERGPGDEPIYVCWACDIKHTPGLALLRAMNDLIAIENGTY